MATEENVCIGDKVTFEYGGSSSFLSADFCGNIIWDTSKAGDKVPSNFTRCVWRVCDKLSYTDQAVALKKQQSDVATQELLMSLAEAEKMRNSMELSDPSGRQVRYGQVVQLQHVATGKFLSAKNTPAKRSRSCLGLFLGDGDLSVYFHILPRYKVRSEGGCVLLNDVVMLEAQLTNGYCVHASSTNVSEKGSSFRPNSDFNNTGDNGPNDGVYFEANLSDMISECGLTVGVYEHNQTKNDFLHIHQCIRFFDREADGFIASSCTYHHNDNEQSAGASSSQFAKKRASSKVLTPLCVVHHNHGIGSTTGRKKSMPVPATSSIEVPQIKSLHVVDNDPLNTSEFSPDAVWEIEYAPHLKRKTGGLVEWGVAQYRVKHTASGRYLTAVNNENDVEALHSDSYENNSDLPPGLHVDVNDESLTLTCEENCPYYNPSHLARQTFSFLHVDSKPEFVKSEDIFVMLCYTSALGRPWYVHSMNITGPGALNMCSTLYPYDAIFFVPVSNAQADAVRFIGNCLPVLQKYLKKIERFGEEAGHGANISEFVGASELEFVNTTLTRLICGGTTGLEEYQNLVLKDAHDIAEFQEHAVPVTSFQSCARDQGLLELLLSIIIAPVNANISLNYCPVKEQENNLFGMHGSFFAGRQSFANAGGGGGLLNFAKGSFSAAARGGRGPGSFAPQVGAANTAAGKDKVHRQSDWEDSNFKTMAFTHRLAWAALNNLVGNNSVSAVHILELEFEYRSLLASNTTSTDQFDLNNSSVRKTTNAMEVILEQVPFPVGAAEFLTSLVGAADDLKTKEKMANTKTISFFKSMIFHFGPQAQFLEFYRAICSSKTEPVPPNQNAVLSELFTESEEAKDDLMITLYTMPGLHDHAVVRSNSGGVGICHSHSMYGLTGRSEEYSMTKQQGCEEYLGQRFERNEVRNGEFPPVFVAWRSDKYWTKGCSSLYWDAQSLGMDSVCLLYCSKQLCLRCDGLVCVDIRQEEVILNKPSGASLGDEPTALEPTDEVFPIKSAEASSPETAKRVSEKLNHLEYINSLRKSKKHVTIEELCWVLHKKVFYEKVRGEPWNEESEEENGKMMGSEGHEMLGFYLQAQIDLLADMARGRNYKVIYALERRYPYPMLVGLIRQRTLPDRIRGSFVKLMRHLWVDRYPNQPHCGRLKLPEAVWTLETVRDISISNPAAFPMFSLHGQSPLVRRAEAMYYIAGPAKYQLLVDSLEMFVGEFDRLVAEKVNQNICLNSVLELIRDLISFGFYATTPVLSRLLSSLVLMLDGRSDVALETDVVHIQESNVSVESVISHVVRYREDSKNHILVNAKINMIDAINVVGNFRRNFFLERFLHLFKLWCFNSVDNNKESFEVRDAHAIVNAFDDSDDKMNKLSIHRTASVPYNATLVDLLMYESDTLFEKALQSLEEACIPTNVLLRDSSQVLLLKGTIMAEFSNLSAFATHISQLQQLYESAEVWSTGRRSSKIRKDALITSFSSIWSILKSFCSFLDPSESEPMDDDDTLESRQLILYNYGVHNILLLSLRWVFPYTEVAANNSVKRSNGSTKTFFSDCTTGHSLHLVAQGSLLLLREMAYNNSKVRKSFNAYSAILCSPYIRATFPNQIFHVLTEIYKGSVDQVSLTPPELFEDIGKLLCGNKQDMGCLALEFYLNQLLPKAEAGVVSRNQILVGKGMLHSLQNNALTVYMYKESMSIVEFRTHVVGMRVLSMCARSVAFSVTNWREASGRLEGVLNALCEIATTDPDGNLFSFVEEENDDGGNQVLQLPLGMGIQQFTIKGDAAQYMSFLRVYIEFVMKIFLDSTAVDISVLFDPVMIRIIVLMSDVVGHFYDPDNSSRNPPRPMISLFESAEKEVEVNDITEMLSNLEIEAGKNDIFRNILNCFTAYVSAVVSSDSIMTADSRDAIYFACDLLYAEFGSSVLSICHDMGYSTEVTAKKFETNWRIRVPVFDIPRNFSRDSNNYSLDNTYTRVVEGIPVRDRFSKYLEAVRSSEVIKKLIADEERSMLLTLLDAESITCPENLDFIVRQHNREGNGSSRSTAISDARFSTRRTTILLKQHLQASARINPNSPTAMIQSYDNEVRTNKVTWEDIVKRMIRYILNQTEIDGSQNSTSSILRILMLYLKDGMDEGSNNGGSVRVNSNYGDLSTRQHKLNDLGITALVFKLLIFWDSGPIFEQSLELGLLLLQGGNSNCQREFIKFARETDADGRFFTHMRDVLVQCQEWITETQQHFLNPDREGSDEKVMRKDLDQTVEVNVNYRKTFLLVIDFIQLLCEGHNLEMQNMLRDQSSFNRCSRNLVFSSCACLKLIAQRQDIYRHAPPAQRTLLLHILNFLIESSQGPCRENQVEIGVYENLSACQIVLAAEATALDSRDLILTVKSKTIDLLAAIFENCDAQDQIIKGTVLKIDMETFGKVYEEFHYVLHRKEMEKTELLRHSTIESEEVKNIQRSINEFTDSICNIMSVRKKLSLFDSDILGADAEGIVNDMSVEDDNMPACHREFSKHLCSVEIYWKDKTEDVVFPIPKEAQFLSYTTKMEFVNGCDLSSADSRVKDLMRSRHDFLDEMEVVSQSSSFFQLLLRNYYDLKMLLFVVILLLTFNLILSLTHGNKLFDDYYSSGPSALIMVGLGLILLFGYSAVAVYWAQQGFNFNCRKLNRLVTDFLEKSAMLEAASARAAAIRFEQEHAKQLTMTAKKELMEKANKPNANAAQSLSMKVAQRSYEQKLAMNSVTKSVGTFAVPATFRSTAGSVAGSVAISNVGSTRSSTSLSMRSSISQLEARSRKGGRVYRERMKRQVEEEASYDSYYDKLHENDLLEDRKKRLVSFDVMELKPVLMLLGIYLMGCVIHKAANFQDTTLILYLFIGLCLHFFFLIYFGRNAILVPLTPFQKAFCLWYDTFTHPNVFGHVFCVILILFALAGYEFLYCLLLIEFIHASVHAKDTVRSLTTSWKQLLNVFILYVILILVFGIMSLVRFGGNQSLFIGQLGEDDFTDSGYGTCNSAWNCLGVIFYGGFLNLDISSVLASATTDEVSWGSRFFFDIPFYLVASIMLIQIVAGIIVDTFADLRQRTQRVELIQKEETFISGITNDMLDGTGITFNDIQNNNQNMWSYLFYAIYLERKDRESYCGIESYVAHCLNKELHSWFPRKTSVSLEKIKGHLAKVHVKAPVESSVVGNDNSSSMDVINQQLALLFAKVQSIENSVNAAPTEE